MGEETSASVIAQNAKGGSAKGGVGSEPETDFEWGTDPELGENHGGDTTPVSYTHLDVYKRQTL